jgi:hypothetical protein
MPKTNKIPFASRPLPRVHEALQSLQVFAAKLLARVNATPREAARVFQVVERACFAVELGATGRRRKYHLVRAQDAVVLTLAMFRQLCLHRTIGAKAFEEIERRISQIMASLESLEKIGEGPWAPAALPPLDPPATDPAQSDAFLSLKRIFEAAVEAVEALLEAPAVKETEPADPTQPPSSLDEPSIEEHSSANGADARDG